VSETVIRRLLIRGRVQGVGFRAWTEDTALINGIDGWVRNRADGAVEAVFAGSAEAVAAMIAACKQGPPSARVERIEESEAGAGDLAMRRRSEGFSTLPTA
jgi:acylphosphatase